MDFSNSSRGTIQPVLSEELWSVSESKPEDVMWNLGGMRLLQEDGEWRNDFLFSDIIESFLYFNDSFLLMLAKLCFCVDLMVSVGESLDEETLDGFRRFEKVPSVDLEVVVLSLLLMGLLFFTPLLNTTHLCVCSQSTKNCSKDILKINTKWFALNYGKCKCSVLIKHIQLKRLMFHEIRCLFFDKHYKLCETYNLFFLIDKAKFEFKPETQKNEDGQRYHDEQTAKDDHPHAGA